MVVIVIKLIPRVYLHVIFYDLVLVRARWWTGNNHRFQSNSNYSSVIMTNKYSTQSTLVADYLRSSK